VYDIVRAGGELQQRRVERPYEISNSQKKQEHEENGINRAL